MGSARRLDSPHSIVVGLQFGDEGKGQLVDRLTAEHDVVVRFNGGANAGHTVRIGDERFALHLVPSGVLSPGKLNVIANGVALDPAVLIDELDALTARGVAVRESLRISDRAHVVMPYHRRHEALIEAATARLHGEDRVVGTTGRGIGPTYSDKALRSTAVRVEELLDAKRLRTKLGFVVEVKNATLSALAERIGESWEPLDADALTEEYAAYGERLRPLVCDTAELLQEADAEGKRILFEGAHSALLDIDHGTYPFVTSSHSTTLGVAADTGLRSAGWARVYGVMKAYLSRVGAGPMPTELHDATGERIREVGAEYGTTTRRPRRCGWLDLVAVGTTARLCGVTDLVITGLGVLSGLPRLRICVGYRENGRMVTRLPADASELEAVQPVHAELDGYAEDVGECRTFDALPAAARAYVERIESAIGPVSLVCVGQRRDQVLARR